MEIKFETLPHDVQLRLMRARAEELCAADPMFREMKELWESNTHHRFVQYVTTRIVERKF